MNGMNATDTLTDRRHKQAELKHLRVFFLRWCEMHRLAALTTDSESHPAQRAAQELVEQARTLQEFYG